MTDKIDTSAEALADAWGEFEISAKPLSCNGDTEFFDVQEMYDRAFDMHQINTALAAERDALRAEVERFRMASIKMTMAEYLEISSKALFDMRSHLDAIRADERAKVIAEVFQVIQDAEIGGLGVGYLPEPIDALHTHASRAIAGAAP